MTKVAVIMFQQQPKRLDPRPSPRTDIRWIGSPNHYDAFAGPPIAIVIHTMVGTLAGTDNWFTNPESEASAHFGVGLSGEIHQYVSTTVPAWANGNIEPGNRWPGVDEPDPNFWSISIETEDNGRPDSEPVTIIQYDSVKSVCVNVLKDHPTIKYLVSHKAICADTKGCPGRRWLDGAFVALAHELHLNAIP